MSATVSRWCLLIAIPYLSLAASPAALAAVDPNAPIILLRQDCGALDDCFESLSDALTWTWSTRNPTATSRLLMDIGPGHWNGSWSCPSGRGFVTVRGAGRHATFIEGAGEGGSGASCTDLEFMDMTFKGDWWGFRWIGDGNSVWTDVDIIGRPGGGFSLGWADDICVEGQEKAVHYFFGSRILSFGAETTGYPAGGFWGECSETWFYGGEVRWEADFGQGNGGAIFLAANTDFRAFGTAIRVVGTATGPVGGFLVGVNLNDFDLVQRFTGEQAVFHMHGGIISLNVDPASNTSLIGLWMKGNTLAHTPGTAWALNGPAQVQRMLTSSTSFGEPIVQVPFLWQSGDKPPTATSETNRLVSSDGQDVFVETDCAASGDCSAGGNQAHLMIYNPAECGTSEPWFDAVTGRCRGDTGP